MTHYTPLHPIHSNRHNKDPNAILAEVIQLGHVCPICWRMDPVHAENDAPEAFDRSWWALEHDHETGRVRGVCCRACNAIMPAHADPATIRRAADWVERGPMPESVDTVAAVRGRGEKGVWSFPFTTTNREHPALQEPLTTIVETYQSGEVEIDWAVKALVGSTRREDAKMRRDAKAERRNAETAAKAARHREMFPWMYGPDGEYDA